MISTIIKRSVLFLAPQTPESHFLAEQLMMRADYAVSSFDAAQGNADELPDGVFDVVIMDLDVPAAGSVGLVRAFKDRDKDCVIIALVRFEEYESAAHLGVYEIMRKPVNPDLLALVIRKGIEQRQAICAYQKLFHGFQERVGALEKQNNLFAGRIEESTRNLTRLYENLRTTYLHTIKVLAQAIDARDHYTHSHSENVVAYAVGIAREMGLSSKEIETISEACQLHDLGKIGIEDNVLGKVTALTDQEWAQIRRHPVTGAQILEPLTFLNDVIELVRQHHEHFDGTGYPDGRKGGHINLGARIIHLADAYEAMRSARSYRKNPLTKEAALQEVRKHSGTQFDPDIVRFFLTIVDRLDPGT